MLQQIPLQKWREIEKVYQINKEGTITFVGFTGKEKDSETGLNYYGARYYDSELKYFTQADSVIADVYDPQQLNRYGYARDNPCGYTDPSGNYLSPLDILDYASLVYSTYALFKDPSLENAGFFGLDLLSAAVPVIGGAGFVAKGGKFATKIDDVNIGSNIINDGKSLLTSTKNVPNPFGAKGGLEHQTKNLEIFKDIESRGLIPQTEVTIKGAESGKVRRADVVGIDESGNIVEIHQSGRRTTAGNPVSRETNALNDIKSSVESGGTASKSGNSYTFSEDVSINFHDYLEDYNT
ncbi:hypothetical protein COU57_04350 [Candidatus Pacearchaeota archaeon CG10_big_fil_rev_8_21_14_0_10_32_14]|nr:MAG: hypothetical protein COU57_04350 [Candidatus Pacearchaeota archaeon CG10_big_fil_rev_8_21_14_0_10_32_14]